MQNFTPPVEQLLPFTQLKCTQPNCSSTFTNAGNLEMHLQKHHKITTLAAGEKLKKDTIFFCPDMKCIYNVSRIEGKHFKCLKYLRQHYQKVHIIKSHACGQCGKLFTTPGLLKSHQINTCGKKFVCQQCGWQYDNREALLLHGRRKGHDVHSKELQFKKDCAVAKLAIPRLKAKSSQKEKLLHNQHQQTQTEGKVISRLTFPRCNVIVFIVLGAATLPEKHFKVTSAQTDCIQSDMSNTVDICFSANTVTNTATYTDGNSVGAAVDFPLLLCDIQTQTELQDSSSNNLLDQMFAHSTHMHTQTCDDFLRELGLADIQTQTNWSNLDNDRRERLARGGEVKSVNSEFGSSTSGAYDELLVSTETQTSFTQCLLDSCSTTAHESTDSGPFSGLYTTQHTQTCDTLLEGLFGSQESDFMGTFQSTYTQT